jgi:hypothetical protein
VAARHTALPTFAGDDASTEPLCVDFSYQLRTLVSLNLTADVVFQQTGNSLRVGLEDAGRAVTVAFVEDYYDRQNRRLLAYSEEFPSTVTAVVDMPFCESGNRCLLLQHFVCVVGEAGVDGDDVHGQLTQTLRGAIQSGRFFDEIPPEHLPPP